MKPVHTQSTHSSSLKPQCFPVSIKGVILDQSKVVLLKNEREEWELPGGRIEIGETPEACVAREIEEELGLCVSVERILDTWMYHIREDDDVLIVTFGCRARPFSKVTHSPEHKAVGWFDLSEVHHLKMPDGYKKSIAVWASMQAPGE